MSEEHDVRNDSSIENDEKLSEYNRTAELPASAIKARLDNAKIQIENLIKIKESTTDKNLLEKIDKRISYWNLAIRSYETLLS